MDLYLIIIFILFGYIVGAFHANYLWAKKATKLVCKIEIQKLELARYRKFFRLARERQPKEVVMQKFENDRKFINIVKKVIK